MSDGGRSILQLAGTPVLMYHGLFAPGESAPPGPEGKYWVSTDLFGEHLKTIAELGAPVRALAGLVKNSEADGVVLTFDDGKISDFTYALPRLADRSMTATFFVNTANVGRTGYCGWPDLRAMDEAGMAVQSHSHEHVDHSRLERTELLHQFRTSRLMLEDKLGREAPYLSVPFGLVNRTIIETAMEAGFDAVCTSRSLPARPGARVVNRAVVDEHLVQRIRAAERLERRLAAPHRRHLQVAAVT